MAVTRDVAVGVCRARVQTRQAIEALKDAGFAANDISILMRDRDETRTMAEDTGASGGAMGEAATLGYCDIGEGWDVYDRSGEKIGDVDRVEDDYLRLKKGCRPPRHPFIPLATVTRVEHDRVSTGVLKSEVEAGRYFRDETAATAPVAGSRWSGKSATGPPAGSGQPTSRTTASAGRCRTTRATAAGAGARSRRISAMTGSAATRTRRGTRPPGPSATPGTL